MRRGVCGGGAPARALCVAALVAVMLVCGLGAAETASARPAYGWQGTVSIGASEQYDDGHYAARTLVKASFSELSVVDGSYSAEQQYSAIATMTFEQHDRKACTEEDLPSPAETIHRSWTYPGGRTTQTPDPNAFVTS